MARKPVGQCVVAIGASAGGFDAIVGLLRAMPADSGMSFIIVQHLAPETESLSAQLFARHTTMKVEAAEHGMRVLPNCVYTTPPDRDLRIHNRQIELTKPVEARGRRLPVDILFRSLGQSQMHCAIGIVLSGTGSDGTLGLREIVANGGIVLAQSPETAEYDGMPRSALATGLVAHELPVERMPQALLKYARHPYVRGLRKMVAGARAQGDWLAGILGLVRERSGHDFRGYKPRMIERRIVRRMGLLGMQRHADYLKYLRSHAGEVSALRKDLLITVTEFFRDPQAWQALDTQVLRPLVDAKKNGETIRAWVAGTATGEEAFTLAILIQERLRRSRKKCRLQIFATDTNETALEYARRASYPVGIATQVPQEVLGRYFESAGADHHYVVGRELRERVVFGSQNLFTDPPFSRIDLVCCRNLLIYLDAQAQRRILLLFHFALSPHGRLFLGPAETVGSLDKFYRPLSRNWRIYERTGATPSERLGWLPDLIAGPRPPASAASPVPAARPESSMETSLKAVVDTFAPAAVLVNTTLEVLYVSGPIERFTLSGRGVHPNRLTSLLPKDVLALVTKSVRRAQATHSTVMIPKVTIRIGSDRRPTRIEVIPIPVRADRSAWPLFAITFAELTHQRSPGTSVPAQRVRARDTDLNVTRRDLRSTFEQLETANEELRASHEETMSVNEELQSMNEELESSKEELQSLNEEINTVNVQLQQKVNELEVANNDLQNLLASSDVATVCLDRQMRIKWFTPAIRRVFNFLQSDVGRQVADLRPAVTDASLLGDARSVLKTLAGRSSELAHEGSTYLRRIAPYRTEDERIEGVVITYTDISETKRQAQAELEARAAINQQLERRVQDRTAALQKLSTALALAEVHERKTIARDLHDGLGQDLNAALIKLHAARQTIDANRSATVLGDVQSLLEGVVRQMRSLTAQLNPPALDRFGLVGAFEWLGEEIRKLYDLMVLIEDDERPKPLTLVKQSIVYRAVRELLINAARHAKVKQVRLETQLQGKLIRVRVSDHGVGFVEDKDNDTGLGLPTIRDRIAYIGGQFLVETSHGKGTAVTIEVPTDAE